MNSNKRALHEGSELRGKMGSTHCTLDVGVVASLVGNISCCGVTAVYMQIPIGLRVLAASLMQLSTVEKQQDKKLIR